MTALIRIEHVSGLLLDIEGTTTPIAFVHEVLFPYSRSHVKKYLQANFDSEDTLADLKRLREEYARDRQQDEQVPPLVSERRDAEIDSFARYVGWLIDRDRKSAGLKSLQGKIWKQGYLEGTLRAPLFPDVVLALKRWHDKGMNISIFSSGSSLAQQLLFAHTDAGDLSNLIDHYFDTTVGAKADAESYRRIAESLNLRGQEILFISDVVSELDAASTTGMQTALSVRPGNPPQPASTHQPIQNFNDIDLHSSVT